MRRGILSMSAASSIAMNQPTAPQPPRIPPPVKALANAPVQARPLHQLEVPRPTRLSLHPMSAVALLGIDNLFFGAEAITFELAWPLISLVAFLITSTLVFGIQMALHRDRFWVASSKAFLCGVLAGVPTSIGGTIFATLVLLWAGLAKMGRFLSGKG